MLHKGRESVSTQAESVASTVKSEVEKFNTQVLYHSLKSLNRLSGVVHKMEYEVTATVHFPIWHQEIEDIIVLKNNKGTEDNRVRKLDYSIQISKLFYERFIADGEISLFSPHDVQVSMMLLALISLTTYILITNEMILFRERLLGHKN